MIEPNQSVKSADRVLDLFELLAKRRQEMTHSEIADALEIPKSSLSQLLKNLVARGYVDLGVSGKGYHLGKRFADLARQTAQAYDLVSLAGPVLAELTETTRESSALNLLKGDKAEVVATVSSPQRLVSHMRLGDLAPLYATSGGKAILAFLAEDVRKDYLDKTQFEAITSNTITSKKDLFRQLQTIRREGIAYSLEEFTPGIVGIAMPLLSEANEALGALNVAMPAVRYSTKVRDRVVEALERAIRVFSRHLRDLDVQSQP